MRIIDFLAAKPARFFLLSAILWFGLMCWLNSRDGSSFVWHDILVEANGMTFDLLVFGVLLSVYEALKEKKDKIERLREEIDDYRRWNEKEATFRIVGAIKRLNKLGVTEIDLRKCFLEEAKLDILNLTKADFTMANLANATLMIANLEGAIFVHANLEGADLAGANLRFADLTLARLVGADLSNANLEGANLDGARVRSDWFNNLEKWSFVGREEVKEKYLLDENGFLILKSELALRQNY